MKKFGVLTLVCLWALLCIVPLFSGLGYPTKVSAVPAAAEADYEQLLEIWGREANFDSIWDHDQPFIDEDGNELRRGAIKEEQQQPENAVLCSGLEGELLPMSIPQAHDLSINQFFPQIKSQGSQGSCAAWSTTYYTFTYEVARLKGINVKPGGINNDSVVFSPKWTYNFVNGGTDSGSTIESNIRTLQRGGSATWAAFPYSTSTSPASLYREWPLDASTYRNALNARVSTYERRSVLGSSTIITNTIMDIKQWVYDGHPVNFDTYFNWTVKTVPIYGQVAIHDDDIKKTGHAMTIVGYDDNLTYTTIAGETLTGAFKVANSHGTGYGNSGFMWLMYDAIYPTSTAAPSLNVPNRVGAFGFNNAVFYMNVQDFSADINLTCEVTLNTAARNTLYVYLGKSTNSYMTIETVYAAFIGGAYSFSGTSTAVDCTFTFDFKATLPELAVASTVWRLSVQNTGGATSDIKRVRFYKGSTLVDEMNPNETVTSSTTRHYTYSSSYFHTVTYNYSENGGTSASQTSASVKQGNPVPLTPTATKTDWTFIGWHTDPTKTFGLESLTMGTVDIIIYAIFSLDLFIMSVEVSGTPVYGATLTTTLEFTYEFTEYESQVSYQWKRGSADIQGANSSHYTLASADVGQTVCVVVTSLQINLAPGSVTSLPTAQIQKATLTISGVITAVNRDYDGTTYVALAGGTLQGVVPGDTVAFSKYGVIANANAGLGKSVVTHFELYGAANSSYILIQPVVSLTVDIYKAVPPRPVLKAVDYQKGLQLLDFVLPEGWHWDNSGTFIAEGGKYKAFYDGSENFKASEEFINYSELIIGGRDSVPFLHFEELLIAIVGVVLVLLLAVWGFVGLKRKQSM